MFITADQILCHLIGDYILQSQWMANNKTKNNIAAAIHSVFYTIPFVFITYEPIALVLIAILHYPIDRYRLARFVVWFKNGCQGEVTDTGYPRDMPPFMSIWLYIIADNILHLIINGTVLWLIRS